MSELPKIGGHVPSLPQAEPAQARDEGGKGPSFADTLKAAIRQVNTLNREAEQTLQGLVLGEHGNLHQTIIALEKADISFQIMLQVRNKIVAAYEEINRMQV